MADHPLRVDPLMALPSRGVGRIRALRLAPDLYLGAILDRPHLLVVGHRPGETLVTMAPADLTMHAPLLVMEEMDQTLIGPRVVMVVPVVDPCLLHLAGRRIRIMVEVQGGVLLAMNEGDASLALHLDHIHTPDLEVEPEAALERDHTVARDLIHRAHAHVLLIAEADQDAAVAIAAVAVVAVREIGACRPDQGLARGGIRDRHLALFRPTVVLVAVLVAGVRYGLGCLVDGAYT